MEPDGMGGRQGQNYGGSKMPRVLQPNNEACPRLNMCRSVQSSTIDPMLLVATGTSPIENNQYPWSLLRTSL
jgi:hypothetical protein